MSFTIKLRNTQKDLARCATVDIIVEAVVDVIDAVIRGNVNENDIILPGITVAQLVAADEKFYCNSAVVEHMCQAFLGRLTRAICVRNSLDINIVHEGSDRSVKMIELLSSTDSAGDEAAKLIVQKYSLPLN